MPEFEELPLHFLGNAAIARCTKSGTFCPSRLRPAPRRGAPRVVRVDARCVRRGGDGEITRIDVASVDSTADALTAVSGEVVTALDRLLATLKSRDEEATREASARTAEEEEKLRRATVRVAVAHAAAAGTWTRRWRSTRRFAADARKLWGTSWTRSGGGTARTFATRRFASSVIFAVGAVGNTREREKGAHGGFGVHATHDAVRSVRAWRVNAAAFRRVRLITEAADTRRVWARRRKVFESRRNRAERGAAFRVGVERLAVAIAWRRAAPIFVTWRVAARRRVRQKRVAVRLLTSANRRAKSYFFQTWARIAAGLARARVLDTAAARPRREGDGGGGGEGGVARDGGVGGGASVADLAAAGRFALANGKRESRASGGDGGDVPTRRRRGGERRRAGPRRRR